MAMLAAGYFWGRSFIAPLLALTRGTRALAAGRLNERVTVSSNDELGQLAAGFNNMADRLVELQEDVRKKERQAIFGRIAIGLVHDLSHPIQNLGNSCKLIVKMFEDQEYRETFKRTIERELAQVKRVLDDLRNVARPIPMQRFPLDLNKVLAELVESMQPTGLYKSSELNASHASDGDTLLALDVNGEPLHIDHGYPVRLIGPNRPGVMQTKWVARLVVL